ncbi:MAG TPA: serine/threonine-protein kinase [Pseudonocardia sp.]|nr:serine/threonine-protein kinase [Pseudonocardia sp.]
MSDETPDPGQPRRVGGRYRLAAQIGSGAMGTVWSGFDELLHRHVAVKQLKVPPGIPEREAGALRERMLREARALGGLSHPNVVTLYDVVDVDGEPMVVLEMVASRNLATMIAEQGPLDDAQAAAVGFATAAALRAAHRAGITHRDVKPANVLVAHDGRIKLSDFGIARNAADAPMTTEGLVLGSPAYIAPEVAAGDPVTPAADLWSLGATLFAAVEGRPPYDVRNNPVATIAEVVDGEVPRPRCSGPVAEVITALMTKDPARRMPLEAVRRTLRPLIADPDDPLYPGSPDAPTMAATVVPPRQRTTSGPYPAAPAPVPAGARRAVAGAAPLAADPGPVPGPPRPPAGVPTRSSARLPAARRPAPLAGFRAAALVVAGAAAVLAGTVGGWTVTRLLAAQSPLTTATVTGPRAELVAHVDPLGFTTGVPLGWAPYRYEGLDGTRSVSFVSPDGTEELTLQRVASPEAAVRGLAAEELGVDTVEVTPGEPAAGGTQLGYRTTEGPLRRTSWLRVVPTADGAWTVRLTVPSDRAEGVSAELFDVLADRFAPAPR